ncbi:hypothetical protein BN1708_012456, partial [Verticillium longisporum]
MYLAADVGCGQQSVFMNHDFDGEVVEDFNLEIFT